jgi:mobilization protein NikA
MTKSKTMRQKKYDIKLTIRATRDEHEGLMNRAQESRLSLSRYLIECGLNTEAPTWEAEQRHERTIVQIARAGNNLNQIAKRLNSQRGVIDYSKLEQTVKAIMMALKEIQEFKR